MFRKSNRRLRSSRSGRHAVRDDRVAPRTGSSEAGKTVNVRCAQSDHGAMNLKNLTADKLALLYRNRDVTVTEVVRNLFEEIDRTDPSVRAFITLARDRALEDARRQDTLIAAGEPIEALAGIPVAIKDNIAVRDLPTTCGSKILQNYVSPYSATAVERLRRAGAIVIGKTNLDEFAMGSSTENSGFFPTRNPHDLTRVPGGSSGGSAASVAAGMAVAALGSDTGGSVRQPASFCGVVGVKPTYGRVSRYGLVAFASSLDQIGVFSKTVRDAAQMLEVISGFDHYDSTSADTSVDRTGKWSRTSHEGPPDRCPEGILHHRHGS